MQDHGKNGSGFEMNLEYSTGEVFVPSAVMRIRIVSRFHKAIGNH